MDEWELQECRQLEADQIKAGMDTRAAVMKLMEGLYATCANVLAPAPVSLAFGSLTDEDKREFREAVRDDLFARLKSEYLLHEVRAVVDRLLRGLTEELLRAEDPRRAGLLAELRERVWESVRTHIDAAVNDTAKTIVDRVAYQVAEEARARLTAKPTK